MHSYANSVSKSVYRGSNVLLLVLYQQTILSQAFTLNALTHAARVGGLNVNVSAFDHEAIYDLEQKAIFTHVVANQDTSITTTEGDEVISKFPSFLNWICLHQFKEKNTEPNHLKGKIMLNFGRISPLSDTSTPFLVRATKPYIVGNGIIGRTQITWDFDLLG